MRPSQIIRRLRYRPTDSLTHMRLPWNCGIYARSSDTIGQSIATLGIYDLIVTEAILRLASPGDSAIDVGANIGYTSLLFSLALGNRGRVLAFEPASTVLPILRKNVDAWRELNVAPIKVEDVALSDRDGTQSLYLPDNYEQRSGDASLEAGSRSEQVQVRRLDSLTGLGRVDIMKIDVEGHEAAVFTGGEKLLSSGALRNILFEEHLAYPAPSHLALLRHGYSIFRLTRSTFRPLLAAPETDPYPHYLPSNFLATLDP